MSMLRLNNPSPLPQGVVEGYQQQNTNIAAARVGLDTTNPFDNGTTITIPIGGVVEVNGVMYRVTSQFSRAKPIANIAYWVVVVPSADGTTATFDLVIRPGVWNPERQGCYFTNNEQGHNNRRTLNWVSRGFMFNTSTGGGSTPTWDGDVYTRNTKTFSDIISLQKGWYLVELRSGLGGGNGENGAAGGAGGVPLSRRLARLIFFADKPFYNIKIGGNGNNGNAGALSEGIRGGGGGGGAGEETVFDGLSTDMVPPGNGGNGSGHLAGRGGRSGSNGNDNNSPSALLNFPRGGLGGLYFGGGGGAGGMTDESLPGGDGGDGGAGGQSQNEGAPGGACNIYSLGN